MKIAPIVRVIAMAPVILRAGEDKLGAKKAIDRASELFSFVSSPGRRAARTVVNPVKEVWFKEPPAPFVDEHESLFLAEDLDSRVVKKANQGVIGLATFGEGMPQSCVMRISGHSARVGRVSAREGDQRKVVTTKALLPDKGTRRRIGSANDHRTVEPPCRF